MYRALLVALCFFSTTAVWPQASTFSTDTLWIHHAQPDEEDLDSFFPIVKCSENAAIAENINTVLQMKELGFTLTTANKTKLLTPTDNPFERSNFDFSMQVFSDRLISFKVGEYQFNNTMSLDGYDDTHQFLFDAYTGELVRFRTLFSDQGWEQLNKVVVDGFRRSFIAVMGQYTPGFSAGDEQNLDADCQCDCTDHLDNALCEDDLRVTPDASSHSFIFEINDCDWSNPRSHDTYTVKVPGDEVSGYFSPTGKMYFGEGPLSRTLSTFALWKGMINNSIPVTFLLQPAGCDYSHGAGVEVYDKYGNDVPLTFENDHVFLIHEMSPDGQQQLATIKVTMTPDMKMIGNWTKSDGSRTFTFLAHLASANIPVSSGP